MQRGCGKLVSGYAIWLGKFSDFVIYIWIVLIKELGLYVWDGIRNTDRDSIYGIGILYYGIRFDEFGTLNNFLHQCHDSQCGGIGIHTGGFPGNFIFLRIVASSVLCGFK